jgi:hypothetical protein
VPKKIIPDKTVPVPMPEEPEAPPAPGTWLLYKSWEDDRRLHHLALIIDKSSVFIFCLSPVLMLWDLGNI